MVSHVVIEEGREPSRERIGALQERKKFGKIQKVERKAAVRAINEERGHKRYHHPRDDGAAGDVASRVT
jgi:hypothetical protein